MHLKQILNAVRSTDGPGYTDHPRADIRAHRSNAKWARRFGWSWLAITVAGTALSGQYGYLAVGFGVWVLAQFSSMDMRLQALEWETELEDIGEDP